MFIFLESTAKVVKEHNAFAAFVLFFDEFRCKSQIEVNDEKTPWGFVKMHAALSSTLTIMYLSLTGSSSKENKPSPKQPGDLNEKPKELCSVHICTSSWIYHAVSLEHWP